MHAGNAYMHTFMSYLWITYHKNYDSIIQRAVLLLLHTMCPMINYLLHFLAHNNIIITYRCCVLVRTSSASHDMCGTYLTTKP